MLLRVFFKPFKDFEFQKVKICQNGTLEPLHEIQKQNLDQKHSFTAL